MRHLGGSPIDDLWIREAGAREANPAVRAEARLTAEQRLQQQDVLVRPEIAQRPHGLVTPDVAYVKANRIDRPLFQLRVHWNAQD